MPAWPVAVLTAQEPDSGPSPKHRLSLRLSPMVQILQSFMGAYSRTSFCSEDRLGLRAEPFWWWHQPPGRPASPRYELKGVSQVSDGPVQSRVEEERMLHF